MRIRIYRLDIPMVHTAKAPHQHMHLAYFVEQYLSFFLVNLQFLEIIRIFFYTCSVIKKSNGPNTKFYTY